MRPCINDRVECQLMHLGFLLSHEQSEGAQRHQAVIQMRHVSRDVRCVRTRAGVVRDGPFDGQFLRDSLQAHVFIVLPLCVGFSRR